ncbi:ABC transporter ATP-binding protein/permease [Desulfobotulus sp. H1]|uniref:ABC transporter ATP-binding protein/permease n=1 Tax=Desulfobotulus pelophilus TaxID=2823377 RepID=A0ABT3NBC3_9BACT|nr:ABC transporter ATP-binding protein [Desulfobotulus pelophilus]MCW7754262.1 ABC transporter ATP-binding protein/permease [Desulfobotulus pelophilus]
MDDMGLVRRLFPFMRPHMLVFGLAVMLVFALTALDLAIPWLTKQAVDRYIVPVSSIGADSVEVDPQNPLVAVFLQNFPEARDGEKEGVFVFRDSLDLADGKTRMALREADGKGVVVIAFMLLAIALAHASITFIHTLLLELGGQRIIYDIRLAIFAHMRRLPLSYFHGTPLGRMVTRVTGDVENVSEMFTSVVTFVFKDFFLVIGIVIMLFLLDVRLAMVTVSILPLVVVIAVFFAKSSRKAFRELRVRIAEINSRFSETIGGMTVIRLFGWQKETGRVFEKVSYSHYEAGMRQVKIFAVFMPAMEILSTVGLALILYYGGLRVVADGISLGILVAFISYLRMFFRPVRDIAEKYNTLQNAFSSAERLFQILDEPEGAEGKKGGRDPGPVEKLAFSRLSFGYETDTPILKDLDFEVRKGETLAIVGPTGAGKTSLVSLLVRFWDPAQGLVLVNGVDLRELCLESWRSRIAMVMQDPFLFAGTLRDNIQSEEKGLHDAKLEGILRDAGCGLLLSRLPMGLDTLLEEDGKPLSSGERQLVSIARAFARDPEILILDEATSYVDSLSEGVVQEALSRLMKGRTTFLIAHRLSTARHADRILVLRRGRIVESGTHDELLSQKGLYWRMQHLETVAGSSA